ncbi:HpcH/HpaI aldolase family protein [Afifella pfennigii]|uniref:HpcH/HpaI aldolase family protein n=1 Tax=Afifella pfennigii TaxID=209897 RepID=UPI00047E4F67|nr:HpcH/HpaI aldolase/citrate lyase family protein [Afifella pfennigii]
MQLEQNRFKQAIRAGRQQVGIWSALCSNIVADILSTTAFDWALIDMEHSPNELRSVLSQLQAYRNGSVAPVVRPPWNEPVMVKRLLDLGATSLLFPMVQNAQEAEAAVKACRYPPRGVRGVSLSHRGNRYGDVGDYLERYEAETAVLVQIETQSALERVDEITAVDGVDGVFFGPADLSADMGLIGQPGHEKVTQAIRAGAARVRAAGKPTGILVADAALGAMWLKEGLTFVACGTDLGLLAKGARALNAAVRKEAGLA